MAGPDLCVTRVTLAAMIKHKGRSPEALEEVFVLIEEVLLLDRTGSIGGRRGYMLDGYIVKVELTQFADKLGTKCQRKRSQHFLPEQQKG